MKRAVITGAGVVSPLGVGWKNWVEGLRSGASGTRVVSLFDAQKPVPSMSQDGSRAGQIAASAPLPCRVAAEVSGFEPSKYLDPKDRDRVPRAVPMALCAAREALAQADLPDDARQNCAVLLGSGGGGFSFAEEPFTRWFGREDGAISPYAVSSAIPGMISSELSIAFGLRGRSHTVSDGCTSASDAIGYALDLIRNGRAERVLCGGADAPITPATIAAFCMMRVVPTGWNDKAQQAARPFDRDRDGFVLGEGSWIFVVEEESVARERGANILAEIAGYGASCEAYHRVALGEPDEAARAMKLALDDAGVAAEEIDYVNLHGTGTQLNDPLETAAVKMALGARAKEIPMSATKSQIGHPQGASGAAGLAATIVAMQEGFVPPTINLDCPAEGCDLDYVPHEARAAKVQTALCNCLGFGSKHAAWVVKRFR